MLIGSGFSTPSYASGGTGGISSAAPSTASVKSAGTSEWSRTVEQTPVARESIHRMMSMMKDPEVSGLLATMKADEESAASYDAVVSAYVDNA